MKIATPDHRMQVLDSEGKMTPDFYKFLVAIIAALNALS